ncbi:hypothetical protein VTO42DRAFT_2998 [Malbranchea cinnamomea]
MRLPFLVSLDARSSSSPPSDSLSLEHISYFGRVLLKAPTVEQARSFVTANFSLLDIYVDATTIESVEDIVDLLNAGSTCAFVTPLQFSTLSDEHNIDSSRLVALLASAGDVEAFKSWAESGSKRADISVHCTNSPALDTVVAELGKNSTLKAVYYSCDVSAAQTELLERQEKCVIRIVPSTTLSIDKEDQSPAKLVASAASPDPTSGLYSTIVTDERGTALGFVYSSERSIFEALRTGRGVYQSRKRGLWFKGESSGDIQKLVRIGLDCDGDCLVFVVKQLGKGFCHLGTATCFGEYSGLSRLQKTLLCRKQDAPPGSYTSRLFNDSKLLEAKIMEEAEELCQASSKEDVAAEAADLIYFALTKCIASGVSLEDVEKNLDLKALKVKRRKGDAKAGWAAKVGLQTQSEPKETEKSAKQDRPADDKVRMRRIVTALTPQSVVKDALQRPSQKSNELIVSMVKPIIQDVRDNGDAAVLKYTRQFEKASSLASPVLRAPFPEHLMQLSPETAKAIDTSYENIRRFHAAQMEEKALEVETMPGVVCSRFVRPIERVGLYIPGGTAVLPSTALMLGVPAMVAGCKKIVFASPPRSDGSISPEIVYIAHKVGAESIVLAGGAQAIAAMAYGTESITKVDKILGPGNQFVTAAKMLVSNDTSAGVSIDMPAGPSEVLVIADKHANPAFVASDLLSQAEHGVDSQVILIAVDIDEAQLEAIENELDTQAKALPRLDIVRGSIAHSVSFVVKDIDEALALSNEYAPEHLILQVQNAADLIPKVENAGSVFIGEWTPESVGDYSAGVNHSLPTYGYAKQYSGVNLASFTKHITSSNLTAQGLRNLSGAVLKLAAVEGLDAHGRAVSIRLDAMKQDRT